MVAAVVFAFLVGVAVGVLIGRRAPRPETSPQVTAMPAAPLASSPSTLPPPEPRPAAPNKRGRKAGLTEDSFRPADDILERLRLVAEGKLDPSALADEGQAQTGDVAAEAAEVALANPRLSDAERRVLERLQREAQAGSESDFE